MTSEAVRRPRSVIKAAAATGGFAAALLLLGNGYARAAGPTDCVGERYTAVPVPLMPAAINSAGQVVGTDAHHRAALWSHTAGLQELPLPRGYSTSDAVAINDAGTIAVNAFDRSFERHRAYLYAHGSLRPLEGEQTLAFKVNQAGEVAGEALDAGGRTTQPALWRKTKRVSLGACCAGSAKSLNENGNVVGDTYDAEGQYHAFLWTASQGMQAIAPAAQFSIAVAINDDDQIVVQTFPEIFLFHHGVSEPLQLSKLPSQPHAINNCGAIVGAFGPYFDKERAFIWSKTSGFVDLNTRLESGSGWLLKSAIDINAGGEIIGHGEHEGEDMQGVLLAPGLQQSQ
ncbi:MAG: hypothetical protein M3O06_05650 [Pseudomonadota bacterium]|nr:hypothetical protein [Pseudomonadota bacterium]